MRRGGWLVQRLFDCGWEAFRAGFAWGSVRPRGRRGRRHGLRPVKGEVLEARQLLASDWHNSWAPLNVDDSDDGVVSPLDALLVINELDERAVSDSVTNAVREISDSESITRFVDVNDDGFVTPFDALLVINGLNNDSQVDVFEGDVDTWDDDSILADLQDDDGGRIPQSPAGISATQALQLTLDSGEDLINTHTSGWQRDVDVAGLRTGNYVAVWMSGRQDGSSWGIYGQRFNADGTRAGVEFQVNTQSKRAQRSPAVAMASDGSFVVVWQSQGQDGSGWGVFGQRFDANGAKVGTEFRVTETTRGTQALPAIAFASDGDFVVAWSGRGAGDVTGIFARRFGADGVAQGGEFRVSETTRGVQTRPAVSGTTNGGIAIAWDGNGAGDRNGIFVRRFDASNAPVGGEQLINAAGGVQRFASMSVAADGTAVVTWQQRPEGHGRWDVIAQRLAANGTATGTAITVNQTTRSVQKRADVVHLSDSTFVVGWFGFGMDDRRGIYVRRFNADGTAQADEGIVNETVRGLQRQPSLAPINNGVVVAWEGRGTGDSPFGVFARSLRQTAPPASPVITPISDQTTTTATPVTVDVVATDADTPASGLTFSATATNGATATFDTTTRNRLTVTPAAGFTGTTEVTVTVSDGTRTTTDTFIVTVNATAASPVITPIEDRTTAQGTVVTLDVVATDADTPASGLTFSATATNGATATFDTTTRNRLTVTPTSTFTGTISVTVTVSDGVRSSQDTFVITVNAPASPVITPITDRTTAQGTAVTLDVVATDADTPASGLTFSATANNGATATFDTTTRNRLTVTPTSTFTGTISVTVTVSDGVRSSQDTFLITVNAPASPVITPIEDRTTAQGTAVTLDVVATDADTPASGLTFSATATNGATATFDPTTRNRLTVTPTSTFTGTISVTVTVSDGVRSSQDTFDITVTAAASPVITPIADRTTTQGTAVTLDVLATDADTPASGLIFSATANNGATATFDTTTRNRLTVTPTSTFTGTISVTVTVSDGVRSSQDTFEITVNAPVQGPTIEPIATQTTNFNTPLTLNVVATDPNTPTGDLIYSASSSTSASLVFDATNKNRLTITPPTDYEGQFDVKVIVSDGTNVAEQTFLVDVVGGETQTQTVELIMQAVELDTTAGIRVGDQFDVQVRFRETANLRAIFSAYADLLFDSTRVRVDSINYSTIYSAGRNGVINNSNGIVEEVGAVASSLTPPSDTLVFTLRLTALQAGTTVLTSNAPEAALSEVVVYGTNTDERSNVFYGGLIINIQGA